jgi:hypothetical protein
MNKRYLFALVLVLATGPLAAAQLYRWVDEKGNVEWRDTPPPSTAKGTVEQRNLGSNTIQTSTLPYSVQQAVKNFPVTLWIYDCGEPCTSARSHLARRGVPYTERDAQKDGDTLKKLVGTNGAPVLIVGSTKLKGYLDTDWDTALDAAGYPRTPSPGMKPQAQTPASKPAAAESSKAAPAAAAR